MILAAGEEASRQVTTNGVAPGHHETYGATSRAPIVPLVTGCGRAGTHTVAEVLNSFGIPAIHEGAARDSVAVSWFYAPRTSVEGFADATISDEEGNAIKLIGDFGLRGFQLLAQPNKFRIGGHEFPLLLL